MGAQQPWRWTVVEEKERVVEEREAKINGRKMVGKWRCRAVWRIPPSVYPPGQAAAHRARLLVPTPRTQLTQTLTKGARVPLFNQRESVKW
jgi:hypothetical protein